MSKHYYELRNTGRGITSRFRTIDDFIIIYEVVFESDEILVLRSSNVEIAVRKSDYRLFKQLDDSYQKAINRLKDKLLKDIELNQGDIIDLQKDNNVCKDLITEIDKRIDEKRKNAMEEYEQILKGEKE